MVWIKICGITSVEDALLAAELGADAIGLNFVSASKRRVELDAARQIARAVRNKLALVGVVADANLDEMRGYQSTLGLDLLQLHGKESVETLRVLLPHAFKAYGIGDEKDVAEAAAYPGNYLLVDAKSELGGSGRRFDWSLVRELARQRSLIVAGGLTPENVADAIGQLQPFGVDVASGVEVQGEPRRKDRDRVRRFVEACRH
jgi:phosphoribosylanthranilate isomerase